MTNQEAQEQAAKLGLSTWMVQAVAVGETSHTVDLMCVGFASIELPLAEAETWEEALHQASRIIFSA